MKTKPNRNHILCSLLGTSLLLLLLSTSSPVHAQIIEVEASTKLQKISSEVIPESDARNYFLSGEVIPIEDDQDGAFSQGAILLEFTFSEAIKQPGIHTRIIRIENGKSIETPEQTITLPPNPNSALQTTWKFLHRSRPLANGNYRAEAVLKTSLITTSRQLQWTPPKSSP